MVMAKTYLQKSKQVYDLVMDFDKALGLNLEAVEEEKQEETIPQNIKSQSNIFSSGFHLHLWYSHKLHHWQESSFHWLSY